MAKRKLVVSRRLKGIMVERGITVKKLAEKIGISENSLALKINGHRDWWFREMINIIKELGFFEVKEVFPEIYNSVLMAGQNSKTA